MTSDSDGQVAIPTNIYSYTDEEIIERILVCGNTLTRPDFTADILAYQNEYMYIVASDGTEYKASTLVKNKLSRVIVMIFALLAGVYTLEVRTHFINSSDSGKQLRKAQFVKLLNI